MIKVKVKTGSGRQKIEKISNEEYKISLKEFPEKGKANHELMKLLRRYFKKEVNIVKGLKSKNKIIDLK